MKPPPDRLYGRTRTHALRPRQQLLLSQTLPRLRFAGPGNPRAAFGGAVDEVWLEVGFGGGEHARALAASHPQAGLIAAEVFEQGLCSILAALVLEGGEADAPLPANLRLWDADARRLLRDLPAGSLAKIFLMFPDPWPKIRHAKRRFVHPEIASLVASRLVAGGEWRIASDDPTYQGWVEEVMQGRADFAPCPAMLERPAGWPPTRYEAKAIAAGRQPQYWSFLRR